MECAGAQLVSGDEAFLDEAGACIEDAGCDGDAILECLVDSSQADCQQAWDEAVEGCRAQDLLGVIPDEAGFLQMCDDALAACALDANPGADPFFGCVNVTFCFL